MTSPEQKPQQAPESAPLWLLPGDALARVREVIWDRAVAIDTIVDRLKVGLVKATYETAAWENTARKYPINPNFIAPDYWKHYRRSSESPRVWETSDLRLFIGSVEGSMIENNVYLTFFHVRIGREGIETIIANTPRPRSKSPKWIKLNRAKPEPLPAKIPEAKRPPEEADQAQKGPPVAEGHLKAWYELYQRVYSGAADTEANALASARGMFPGKSVSRESVRALRGAQKRGRKPEASAK